jgi:hypothetical protein
MLWLLAKLRKDIFKSVFIQCKPMKDERVSSNNLAISTKSSFTVTRKCKSTLCNLKTGNCLNP